MTEQQVFDFVASCLLTQRKKSRVGASNRYHGAGGCRCAGGFLIPDDIYVPEMEGHMFSVIYREVWTLRAKLKLEPKSVALVDRLQYIHDGFKVEDWRAELRELGGKRGLDTSVVEGIYS